MKRTKDKIIEFLKEVAGAPLSFKELTHALIVPKDERAAFKELLRELMEEGELIKVRGGRYAIPSKMSLVTGRLTCHHDGFGFVIPEDKSPDIFIGPRRFASAMHGDTVVARVEPSQRGGRMADKREGRIIRVVKRANTTVVGRMVRDRGYCLVEPSNRRILQAILLQPGEDCDAPSGAIVSVEITSWPERAGLPVGRVTEVLGDPDDPAVEADVILRKFGLPNRFPDPVEAEASGVPDMVSEEETRGRTDLRALRIMTIDGETARDFDDAVYVERTKNGGYRLFVSIADVSHYVRPGTAIDDEAYSRGTSVYFPARCIPMLPERLSNGICSLNPSVDRLTMTAELEFDPKGRPKAKKFYESVIRSAERMTYTKVRDLIDGTNAELNRQYAHITEDVAIMAELASHLHERRLEDGTIDFDLPEPQVILDIEGRTEDIIRAERNVAHRLIEEFMLAANRAVAEEFSKRDWPFLYRVHDEPDRESIDDFAEFVFGMGLGFKPGGGPRAFQKVLSAVDGRPEERLINTVLLRSMKQAVYSPDNIGHFGLAFTDYTHFTSPIRRYPDLVVHRLLKLLISGKYGARERERMAAALPEIGAHTSALERKAMEAEREILDLKKAQFMKDKVGEVYEGFISGVTGFGLFVELKGWFVEGLVHVSSIGDDYYVFDEKQHTLTGERTRRRFRLADEVKVKVTGVNLELRRIEMELEGTAGPGGAAAEGAEGGGRPVKKTGRPRGGAPGRDKGGKGDKKGFGKFVRDRSKGKAGGGKKAGQKKGGKKR